jgi:hypothetical protein
MSPIFILLWGDVAQAAEVAASLNPADWKTLDHHAAQHRLRPLLFRRAADGNWDTPPDLMRHWHASHHRSAMRALTQKAALAQIGKTLGNAGVSAAILKGGAFVWSGGIDPTLRPMRDLDLLVRPDDASAATELLRSIGFVGDERSRPSGKHLPAMTRGKVVVEPHLHVFDSLDEQAATREQQFVDRAWNRAVAAEFSGLKALCPTDTLLHLILHAVLDHQFNNGPLLLSDMLALLQRGPIDWTLFWDEAERIKATRACQLALGFGQRVCGLAVDWRGYAPLDLGEREMEQVARLMLVDTDYRSAIGWPGQLMRLSPHRWPAQLATMVRRRGDLNAGLTARYGEPGLSAAVSYAVGADGRSKIADAVRLSLWLRRN